MSNFTFNNTDSHIDVRNVIERYEELETALLDCFNEQQEIEGDDTTTNDVEDSAFQEWVKVTTHDDAQEFISLRDLLEDLKGNGGDEDWRGDWYPLTLIRESAFEEAMDEMVAECYELPELPSFMTVTLDYVALQMDYTSTEIDNVTYLYR